MERYIVRIVIMGLMVAFGHIIPQLPPNLDSLVDGLTRSVVGGTLGSVTYQSSLAMGYSPNGYFSNSAWSSDGQYLFTALQAQDPLGFTLGAYTSNLGSLISSAYISTQTGGALPSLSVVTTGTVGISYVAVPTRTNNNSNKVSVYKFNGVAFQNLPRATITQSANLFQSCVSWSPNGQYLAVVTDGALAIYAFDGGQTSLITSIAISVVPTGFTPPGAGEANIHDASWSYDGKFIGTLDMGGNPLIYAFDGSTLTALVDTSLNVAGSTYSRIAFHPTLKVFALSNTMYDTWQYVQLYSYTDAGILTLLQSININITSGNNYANNNYYPVGFAWSPDGSYFVAGAYNLLFYSFDGQTAQNISAATTLNPITTPGSVSWSPDASSVVTSGQAPLICNTATSTLDLSDGMLVALYSVYLNQYLAVDSDRYLTPMVSQDSFVGQSTALFRIVDSGGYFGFQRDNGNNLQIMNDINYAEIPSDYLYIGRFENTNFGSWEQMTLEFEPNSDTVHIKSLVTSNYLVPNNGDNNRIYGTQSTKDIKTRFKIKIIPEYSLSYGLSGVCSDWRCNVSLPTPGSGVIRVYTDLPQDLYIGISPTLGVDSPMYHISVGSAGNSATWIRRSEHGEVVATPAGGLDPGSTTLDICIDKATKNIIFDKVYSNGTRSNLFSVYDADFLENVQFISFSDWDAGGNVYALSITSTYRSGYQPNYLARYTTNLGITPSLTDAQSMAPSGLTNIVTSTASQYWGIASSGDLKFSSTEPIITRLRGAWVSAGSQGTLVNPNLTYLLRSTNDGNFYALDRMGKAHKSTSVIVGPKVRINWQMLANTNGQSPILKSIYEASSNLFGIDSNKVVYKYASSGWISSGIAP